MAFDQRPYYGGDAGDSGFSAGSLRFRFPPFTPLTLVIMGVCLLVFVVQAFTGQTADSSWLLDYGWLSFRGGEAFYQPWRWISYQYLHGGGLHLFFNMLVLYFFLPQLERRWGWLRAWLFYTAGGIVAGATFGIMSAANGALPPLIGASGSVLATLGACAFLYPQQRVLFFFFPVPIRVLTGLLAVLYLLTILGDRGALSDAAHLGGLAFGYFAPWLAGPLWDQLQDRYQQRGRQRAIETKRQQEEEIDRILRKVHDVGMNQLTRRERNTLQRATQQRQSRDARESGRRR